MRETFAKRIIAAVQGFEDSRLDDSQHIERWVSQFSPQHQELILSETANIVEKFYFSEGKVKSAIMSVASEKLDKAKSYALIPYWRTGSSRDYFTRFAEEYLPSAGININNGSKNFLIIDDFIFSGNTIIREMEEWLESNYSTGITITLITHGYYLKGAEYLKYRMGKAKLKGNYKFNGNLVATHSFDERNLMLPRASTKEAIDYFSVLSNYKKETQTGKPLIPPRILDIPGDQLFSSPTAREIFEQEMLAYGIKIVADASYPVQNSLRPMGFDAQLSYGFGAFYSNFRNISNNCPMAFWYKSDSFYPLLDRKVR